MQDIIASLPIKIWVSGNIQITRDILDLKDLFVQAELGEMDNWQEDTNAWEDEADAAWEAEEVLR